MIRTTDPVFSKANKKENQVQVRTTIPHVFVKKLNIGENSQLVWMEDSQHKDILKLQVVRK